MSEELEPIANLARIVSASGMQGEHWNILFLALSGSLFIMLPSLYCLHLRIRTRPLAR